MRKLTVEEVRECLKRMEESRTDAHGHQVEVFTKVRSPEAQGPVPPPEVRTRKPEPQGHPSSSVTRPSRARRYTSVEDMTQEQREKRWNKCTLLRSN